MKPIRYAIALSAVAVAAAAAPSQAQLRRTTPTQIGTYPNANNVPAGMCQVWINGLPANRQPAPTDCATARANAPAGSRILYGPGTNGTYDPRNGQYGGQQYPGQRGRGNRDWKAEKEREKAIRKAQKERDKEWRKEGRRGRDDHDDDDDDRSRGQYGQYGQYGNRGQSSCVDANRDGICDYRQRTGGNVRFP